ncbi:hypothetical protein KA005_19920 [bacterium]|nr:hypothetical protein [bacterium]
MNFEVGSDVEKKVFKRLESEHEKPLAINKERHNELIYIEIDGNSGTINSLSIEDSKFLTNKLMEIIISEADTRKDRVKNLSLINA